MNIDFTTIIDYIGTFAFAISGIRLASAKRFDWFGAYVVGAATAIGGGTTRDLMLGLTPFWMHQPSYLIVTGLALLFVIMFGKQVIRLNNTFFIFDAIGLGLFTVVGIEKSLRISHVGSYHHGYDYRSCRGCDPGYIYQRSTPNLPQGYLRHRLYSRRINLLRL